MQRIVALIVAFLPAICGGKLVLAGQAPAKIVVGFAAMSSASAVLWTAQDEKLLAKNGIEAELVFMPGAPTLIAALNSGSLAVTKPRISSGESGTIDAGLKALVEAQAIVQSPAKKQTVLRILGRRLNITDPSVADDALQDLWKRMDKKPYPSIEGLRNIQRFMQARNPKVGQVKLQDIIDDTILRELDKSGYIDRTFAEYGVK